MKKETLFLVSGEAIPQTGTEDFSKFSGAFVSIWMNKDSEKNAKQYAGIEVEKAGWQITSIDSVVIVGPEDYPVGDPGMSYFEMASQNGVALLFRTWDRVPRDHS